MYKRLSENETQKYYQKILNETLIIAEEHQRIEQNALWNSIVNQLRDIQKMVVEEYSFSDWEDVYERYTLGTIAIQEFLEGDEMQERLCDIFWGAVHYRSIPAQED